MSIISPFSLPQSFQSQGSTMSPSSSPDFGSSPFGSDQNGLAGLGLGPLLELLQLLEEIMQGGQQQPQGSQPQGGQGSQGSHGSQPSGDPGSGGQPSSRPVTTPGQTTPSLAGAKDFNNLQASPWKSNTNAGEIGGSGKVGGMKITPGQTMDYSSNVGAYGDTLGSTTAKVSPNATKFQLNYDFNPSTGTFKNMQALENDMVVTNHTGQHAVMGSQFNLAEKAPPGMSWFQTWDTKGGKWENAALVPTPKAGQYNSVSMTGTMNKNGTYTYSPLNYNGKTYDLQNNTFATTTSNWTRDEVVVQVQQDANSHGGPLDEQYRNMQLQVA